MAMWGAGDGAAEGYDHEWQEMGGVSPRTQDRETGRGWEVGGGRGARGAGRHRSPTHRVLAHLGGGRGHGPGERGGSEEGAGRST